MEEIYWATLPDGTEIISQTTSGLRQAADDCGHLGHIAIRTRAPTELELERIKGARYAIRRPPELMDQRSREYHLTNVEHFLQDVPWLADAPSAGVSMGMLLRDIYRRIEAKP